MLTNSSNDTMENGSIENIIPYKLVSRKVIPKEKLTLDFASRSLTVEETRITVAQKNQELKDLKQCSRDYFRKEIEALMLNESQSLGLYCYDVKYKQLGKRLVKTMSGLRVATQQNYSNAFFQKLFQVMFGIFDQDEKYFLNLEMKYMNEKRIQYNDITKSAHRSRDKGCFEILAWNVKSEIVKQLQLLGKKSHGYYVSLQLPKLVNGKRMQREKVKYYEEFIKHSNKFGHQRSPLQSDEDEVLTDSREVRTY